MHLVAYDAGDRHWHELRTCEWRRADPTSETRAGGFAATGSKGVGKELRAAAKHSSAGESERRRGVATGSSSTERLIERVGPTAAQAQPRADRSPPRGASIVKPSRTPYWTTAAGPAGVVGRSTPAQGARPVGSAAKKATGVVAARGAAGGATTAEAEGRKQRRREIATAQLSAVLLRASTDVGADATATRQVATLIEAEVARTVRAA